MLSLQLFAHPITNISKSPSNYIQNTFSSLTHQSRTNRGLNNISNNFSPNYSLIKFSLEAEATSSDTARASGADDDEEEKSSIALIRLPELGLKAELMPKHVAVIMDGNRRWAINRMLPLELGHRAGGKAMKKLAVNCSKLGVKVLTVFAFSTENWRRPKEEVGFLMSLFEEVLKSEFNELMRQDMQISVIGDKTRLPQSLQSLISSMELSAKKNKGMRLLIAMNYGGRYEITEACKKISVKVRDGAVRVEDVDEALLEQHLETGDAEFPDPDLLIRTSGETRISNFMLWQLAYTELWFVNKLFPDFEEADLHEALWEFQHRQRRYGGHKYQHEQ